MIPSGPDGGHGTSSPSPCTCSSARRGDEDRDVATKTSLLDGLDVVSVVRRARADLPDWRATTCCRSSGASRDQPVATCPTRLVVPATRAIVFWCKQSLARGDAATARRALSLAHAALQRPRWPCLRVILHGTRRVVRSLGAVRRIRRRDVRRRRARRGERHRGGTRRNTAGRRRRRRRRRRRDALEPGRPLAAEGAASNPATCRPKRTWTSRSSRWRRTTKRTR